MAFDLDGTLAESKQPLTDEMAAAIAGLLAVTRVAVISGGDWPQFQTQVVDRLSLRADLSRLWILPTSGAKMFRFVGGKWTTIYDDPFDETERHTVLNAIHHAIGETGLLDGRVWGEQIEDRGTQFTVSGLGQQAPIDAKKMWDPDFAKRRALQGALATSLPDLSVNIGGSTSIDITRKGIDKGYGLHRLAEQSGVPLTAMIFIGDAVYPGGNDHPVREAGVDTIAVRDVAETLTLIAAVTAFIR